MINGVEHLKMITYVKYKSTAGVNVAVTVKSWAEAVFDVVCWMCVCSVYFMFYEQQLDLCYFSVGIKNTFFLPFRSCFTQKPGSVPVPPGSADVKSLFCH